MGGVGGGPWKQKFVTRKEIKSVFSVIIKKITHIKLLHTDTKCGAAAAATAATTTTTTTTTTTNNNKSSIIVIIKT